MKLFILAALVICAFTNASAQDEPVVVTTTRNIGKPEPRLEVIAIIENGQFKHPGGANNKRPDYKDADAFIKKYLPNGRKFYVVFGGGAAGTINLTDAGVHCHGLIYWNGPFQPGSLGISRIRGQVLGLATTSDRIARSEIWRRAPSAAERTAAVKLAKSSFAKNGVTPAQLSRMETANLTAIDVDGDNRAELVGTFRLRNPDPERPPRYVFLIAEGEGANYKTALASYRDFSKSEIFNIGEETLIDYLDLDPDGVAEIVTDYSNDHAAGHHIYRRQNSEWKLAYESSYEFCKSED
ncbi:MAG: hypothetical protein QOD75_3549 [Blastocatellia bacterium]|jgi:hypothetical protein|nr:hypothetical protein [Blastocatellia bacterium]